MVAFHADLPLSGGFVGVDVFFVISGFVITRLLVSELEPTGRLSFGGFYSRRVRRILPALATTTTVTALLSLFLLSPLGPQQDTASTGLAASFMVANFQLWRSPAGYFGAPTQLNALQHTWSLSVEEQFYLVFPALLALAWLWGRSRRGRPIARRSAAAALVAVGSVSFVLSVLLSTGDLPGVPDPERFAFYGSPTRVWEFAVGALLFLASRRVRRLPSAWAHLAGGVGLGLIAIAAVAIDESMAFPGWVALVPVIGTALVLAGGTATTGGVGKPLSWGPAVTIGDLSYSWYLWHWPAIVFTRAVWPSAGRALLVVAVVASLGVAWITHRLIERPLHRDSSIAGRKAIAVAAICVAVPATACLLVRPVASSLRSDATDELVDALALHADVPRGCDNPTRLSRRPDACTWSVEDPRGRIVLIGDSLAGQYTEAVVAAGNAEGYDVTVATLSACSFVAVTVHNADNDSDRCDAFVTNSLEDLVADPPDLVITSSNAIRSVGAAAVSIVDPDTGEPTFDTDERVTLWGAGLAKVGQELAAEDIPLVVVAPPPTLGVWEPRDCGGRTNYDPESCGTTRDRAEAEEERQRALDALEAGAEDGGATLVDFADRICDDECTARRDGIWLYRDNNHLSIPGTLTLTDAFAEIIAANASA